MMADVLPMLNAPRHRQLQELAGESGWDRLLLYGHGWRKDFFRTVVNYSFFGPHAAALLDPTSGGVTILTTHPWDRDALADAGFEDVRLDGDFDRGLRGLMAGAEGRRIGVAGLEFMETRSARTIGAVSHHPAASATRPIESLRQVKTPDEIREVRRAARLADLGYRVFVDAARVGIAEYELVAEVEAFLKTQGAEDNFMLIGSGRTEVFGMHPPTERRLQRGDNVTTELSPQVNGYFAQICRTLVVGEPSDAQRRSFEIFRDAQQAAQDFLKPGVNIADVARVQNDVFRAAGFGEYTTPKYTRVRGHNLGLYPDENPYVLEDVDCVVRESMVLIAHPNTYLPLSGYMVFGDTLLVTSDGCESLNATETTLIVKEA